MTSSLSLFSKWITCESVNILLFLVKMHMFLTVEELMLRACVPVAIREASLKYHIFAQMWQPSSCLRVGNAAAVLTFARGK
jgi:hypothetical protein